MNKNVILFINVCKISIENILTSFKYYLNTISITKININALKDFKITYKNKISNIENIAKLDIQYAYLIHIIPCNKNFMTEIIKVIKQRLYFVNISLNGKKIIIRLLTPNTDQRLKISKDIKIKGEEKKIQIRNIRRIHNNQIKKYIEENNLSVEYKKNCLKNIQIIMTNTINTLEKISSIKLTWPTII
jgi:ribosome recycling factor